MCIHTLDQQAFSWINQSLSNPFFDALMPLIRNKLTWIPLYVLLLFYLIKNHRQEKYLFCVVLIVAIICSDSLLCNLLKNWVQRTRPCNAPSLAAHMHLLLKHCSGGFSFPSAHAANHATLAVFTGLFFRSKPYGKLLFGILLCWAMLIAFAQVYVGVHYPVDVLAGYFLGTINGMLFFYLYTKANTYFYNSTSTPT